MAESHTTLEECAKWILRQEEELSQGVNPEPMRVVIDWHDHTYIGLVKQLAPEYSEEIVGVIKTDEPFPEELIDEIKRLGPKRVDLYVDNSLDTPLHGNRYILRMIGNVLCELMPEQIEYLRQPSSHTWKSEYLQQPSSHT